MIVTLLTADDYFQAFQKSDSAYSTRAFTELNASNAQAVRYFAALDEHMRPIAGVIMGYKHGGWQCPFSAPYGTVHMARECSAETIYDFVSELREMLKADGPLTFTLAPLFRAEQSLQRAAIAIGNLASRHYFDHNYHYPLAQADDYERNLVGTGRRNYRRSLTAGFELVAGAEPARVYDIITRHHQGKGYPVSMPLQAVEATAQIIDTDFYVLTLGGADVAAAMIQRSAPGIAQLIYWGDLPGCSHLRPMNYLASALCRHYAKEPGLHTLDFGVSSSAGVPSPGLCRFKESLGCKLSLKPTFIL